MFKWTGNKKIYKYRFEISSIRQFTSRAIQLLKACFDSFWRHMNLVCQTCLSKRVIFFEQKTSVNICLFFFCHRTRLLTQRIMVVIFSTLFNCSWYNINHFLVYTENYSYKIETDCTLFLSESFRIFDVFWNNFFEWKICFYFIKNKAFRLTD